MSQDGPSGVRIFGRSSSHFTRCARVFAHELGVRYQLQPIFNFRTLYLGGGNAEHLRQQDLPKNVHLCPNEAGLLGGIALWR